MNWDAFRDYAGYISLLQAYSYLHGQPNYRAETYLRDVESIQPITSRQVAAVALATARTM